MKKQTISKSDVALYAIYLLGGDKDYIHFEEIFLIFEVDVDDDVSTGTQQSVL